MAATDRTLRLLALLLFLAAGATILTALGFEHIGGYQPCALCLRERLPYYIALPITLVTVLAVWRGAPRGLLAALFGVLAIIWAVSFGLGVHHAGVEYHWWKGPDTCVQTGGPGDAASMFNSLQSGVSGPSCDEALWHLFGLSFAGWNAVASLFLVALTIYALYRTLAKRR
ncbi:disulfide bond formation protein B [Afifella sp. JA880]|uniref:disulfide bond formation protein B n=1 Tax=Afifella sp. JA880 TaxID=2975280 RepID=UPI0021BB2B44|nr:disulfide bond formation protein B [Afifella sp. JA880]MCT8268083.1 disulfide bond formation protein B [Afifella sp. JA880]